MILVILFKQLNINPLNTVTPDPYISSTFSVQLAGAVEYLQRGKNTPNEFPDITLNNLMVRLQ